MLALNTILLAGSVTLLSLLAGAPLAFVLSRTSLPGRTVAQLIVASMLFVPLYLHAAAWQAVWGAQGWITNALAIQPLFGWPAVIWIHTAAAIPGVVLIVGVGLRWVEPELEEDALLDASPSVVFRRVTLRRSSAALAVAALWIAASVAGEMTVTNLYQLSTLAEVTYTQFSADGDSGSPLAALLPSMLGIALVIAVVITILTRRLSLDRISSPRLRWQFPLGRWSGIVSVATWVCIAGLAGVPLIGLLDKAGIVVTRTISGWDRHWSLASCMSMVASSFSRFHRELAWSLLLAATVATVSVVLAVPLAWIARRGGRGSAAVAMLVAVGLVVPGPVIGIAIVRLFNLVEWRVVQWLYDRTIAAPVFAQTVRALPLAILVMWYSLRTIPKETLESAALDGAGIISTLLRIVLPARWPALVVAWLVALVVSLGDLAASILVMPPGVETLAIRVFGLIHYGVDDQVAGITLAMVGGFVAIGMVVLSLIRRE